MSPQLKPLLLPQLVQQRQTAAAPSSLTTTNLNQMDLQSDYRTVNWSSSDMASPAVTPIFSPRSRPRFLSSASSLDLPMQAKPESPSPPSLASSTLSSVRYLEDVEEEPMQRSRDEADGFSTDSDSHSENFGLYSCLCDRACSHRNSGEADYSGNLVSGLNMEYDMGFLSDGQYTPESRQNGKRRNAAETAIAELASKLGSRMPAIRRWHTSKRTNLRASPTTCLSTENALPDGAPISHSLAAGSAYPADRRHQGSEVMPPVSPDVPRYSMEVDAELEFGNELSPEDISSLERDRSLATTPLLPPLLIGVPTMPPRESPLQSPKVESSPPPMEDPMSPTLLPTSQFVRSPLSTRPSAWSLRKMSGSGELCVALPGILQDQEYDEWSDRLGHANFTISPQPYDLDCFETEAITKFRSDWDRARSNYTKHLVRTGENYGHTSKTYVLTEAKWAEIEGRWRATWDKVIKQTCHSTPGSNTASRTQSRARGRGRSSSSHAAVFARQPTQDDLAKLEWMRVDDCLPSAVTRMLESLQQDGKCPGRGDEDIVGPMQRDAVMKRPQATTTPQEAKGRFRKLIADKLGLRK
ncbi:hypothetical protein E4U15_003057 [Claviceps sp. LM218 group G6]|nr:hypothetical protein E4U15_003057 [Claviceps sp. LM218 group G6]